MPLVAISETVLSYHTRADRAAGEAASARDTDRANIELMESNMIYRMNLFMTKGVRRAACSRKGTVHEEVSSGTRAHKTNPPASPSMGSQLAEGARHLRVRASGGQIQEAKSTRLQQAPLLLQVREDLQDPYYKR